MLLAPLFRAMFKNTPEGEGAFSTGLNFHFEMLTKAALEIHFHHTVFSVFIMTGMCLDNVLPNNKV